MDTTRSNSLDLLRVIAIVCVTLIHSAIGSDVRSGSKILEFIGCLTAGAVPAFFLLSGYLGARKINSKDVDIYSYIKEKFHTLAVPFLFWNALVLSLVFVVKFSGLSELMRGGGAYFDVDLTFTSMASALLGIGRLPIVYQFWFLRDLIVVSLVSVMVCRYTPRIPLLSWLLFFIPLGMAHSMAYYLLGYSLKEYFPASGFPSPKTSGLYCVGCIVIGWGIGFRWTSIPYPLFEIGAAAFLFFLSLVLYHFRLGKCLAALGAATFMVFAIHEPTQTVIFRVWQAKGWPGFNSAVCYFLVPLVVFCLGVSFYYAMRRFFPGLLKYTTGGR